jgi:hypothetical protein
LGSGKGKSAGYSDGHRAAGLPGSVTTGDGMDIGISRCVGLVGDLARVLFHLDPGAIPALVGLAVLAVTYRRFRLTRLTYTLRLIHCIILHFCSEIPS